MGTQYYFLLLDVPKFLLFLICAAAMIRDPYSFFFATHTTTQTLTYTCTHSPL